MQSNIDTCRFWSYLLKVVVVRNRDVTNVSHSSVLGTHNIKCMENVVPHHLRGSYSQHECDGCCCLLCTMPLVRHYKDDVIVYHHFLKEIVEDVGPIRSACY